MDIGNKTRDTKSNVLEEYMSMNISENVVHSSSKDYATVRNANFTTVNETTGNPYLVRPKTLYVVLRVVDEIRPDHLRPSSSRVRISVSLPTTLNTGSL